MKIIIKKVKPESVARILDVIRQNRVEGSEIIPSNWHEGIEVHPDDPE